jgi:dihydrofolate reductase
MKTLISLIVAYDENRGIGAGNDIPWFIKGELKWVADTTKHVKNKLKINALIMGRKTWESLPENRRPLPDRLNIVISRTLTIDHENVLVFGSLDEALNFVSNSENIETAFIFGGSSIYNLALDADVVDQVLATEVHVSDHYFDGIFKPNYQADTFFPELSNDFVEHLPEYVQYGNDKVKRITFLKKIEIKGI